MRIFITIFLIFIFHLPGLAQSFPKPVLEREVTLNVKDQSFEQLLDEISKQTGVIFSYSPEVIDTKRKISFNVRKKTVRQVLAMADNSLEYKVKGKYLILKKNSGPEGNKKVVEGYITDATSGEKLTGATVYNKDLMLATLTDRYGYFRLEIPENYQVSTLKVSKYGFADTALTQFPPSSGIMEVGITSRIRDNLDGPIMALKSAFDTLNSSYNTLGDWLISKNILVNSKNITDTILRNIEFSLVPSVSTNRLMSGSAANKISINLTVGYSQEIRGFEAAGVMNIVRGDAYYCQVAGVGNYVGGDFKGFQAGYAFNFSRNVHGVQATGGLNSANQVKGAQFSGGLNRAEHIYGIQAAGLGNITKTAGPLQAAGVFNISNRFEGLQLAGIINQTDTLKGLQVAGIINTAGKAKGAQIAGIINVTQTRSETQIAGLINQSGNAKNLQLSGFMNLSKVASGLQLSGFINQANRLKGVQIGFINLSDTCNGIPIGFFSFVKHGYHKIELSADEMKFANLSFRSGVNALHVIFLAGYLMDDIKTPGNPVWTFGYGWGLSVPITKGSVFDLDLLGQNIYKGNDFDNFNSLVRLYAGFDFRLFSKVYIAAGLTGNVLASPENNPRIPVNDLAPYTLNTKNLNHSYTADSWVGFKIGLRFL